MAIASSLSGGQGTGTQIGGVTAQQSQYVAQQVALQQERRQQTSDFRQQTKPATTPMSGQNWEGIAFILLGML